MREVFDEESGRWRLVKGSGEIIERIVSRDQVGRSSLAADVRSPGPRTDLPLAPLTARRDKPQRHAVRRNSRRVAGEGNGAGEGKGAEKLENSKIQGGGASTLQGGRRITITRGVNLDNTDWKGEDLRGVAFQQSVVRSANFEVC